MGAPLLERVSGLLRQALTEGVVRQAGADPAAWLWRAWRSGSQFFAGALLVLLAAALASALQAGVSWRSPVAGRLPLAGLARPRRAGGGGIALAGLLVVGACLCVAGVYLVRAWEGFAVDPAGGAVEVLLAVGPALTGFLAALCAVLLAAGVADLLYRRWAHERRAWMTRTEFLEAMRDQEGHPLTLLRRERRRRGRRT